MVLNEQQNENIFIAYYDSSNILMSKYIYDEKKLAIIFAKGHQYIYENVLPYHYQRFKVSESQGKALKEFIAANYKGFKADVLLDKDVLDGVKKEIEDMKKNK